MKPICTFHQVFKSLYLFGAFCPFTGDHFELEMPECNTNIFQLFLDAFSLRLEDEFNIIMLDNGAFHKAKKLSIPHNIALLFIPPYSPELNPAEKIWWKMKRAFTGKLHKSLDNVSEFIKEQVNILSMERVKKTCRYDYIFLTHFWTKTY